MNEIPAINCSEPRYKSRFSSSHFSLFLLLLLLHKTISREMHSHLFISSLPAYNNASSSRFKHGSLPGCVGLKLMEANGRKCCLKLQTASNLKFSIDINELRHIKRPSSIHYTTPKATDVSAAFDHACESESNVDCSKSLWSIFANQINAFYRFTRPHTIIGTIIGITSVSLLPVESFADLSLTFYTGLLKALVPALLMNIYVVGLNQLFDVDIDKINKPNLPLASGEFSMGTGITIVAVSGIMSFVIGWMSQSPPLFFALLISFLLGSAYSINLPFLRWKRHAFLAASCILCVRAVLVQIAFFLHMKRCVLGREALLTKSVIFATIFMCFFSAVIALFKDIPDVDGDRDFGIQSFSVRLGQERVFWLCIKLLLVAYAAAIFVGACSSNIHQKLVTISGHGFLAAALWVRARSLDLQKKASITSFYMFIWKLFYAEYFLIPFVH